MQQYTYRDRPHSKQIKTTVRVPIISNTREHHHIVYHFQSNSLVARRQGKYGAAWRVAPRTLSKCIHNKYKSHIFSCLACAIVVRESDADHARGSTRALTALHYLIIFVNHLLNG